LILRKCAGCGEIKDRTELLRILRQHNTGDIFIMPDSKKFGRSVYLCKNIECLNAALKKKRLHKMLHSQINQGVLEQIQNVMRTVI